MTKQHSADEIAAKLREVDVTMSQGLSVAEAVRLIGVTQATYERWLREYHAQTNHQLLRLEELEVENTQLRQTVAELTRENMILAEAARGNY
ncbi:transposase [Mesorhizobium sp. M0833]|uniref:transposase n=1 Tax=Mesorhizobium sp. M0833 TaxID=2957009 RepID=UPI00333C71FD